MITAVYSYKWRVFFFWVGILLFFFSLLYVRTSCVSRHPVSYIVSACLVSYCLLVRQQQRFHHPTLRTTSVVLVGCIKKSNITSKHDHCCILVHVRKKSYIVPGKCVPGVILSSPATTTALWTPYIKTNISSSWVYSKQHHQQQACTLLYKQAYQQGAQPPWACS